MKALIVLTIALLPLSTFAEGGLPNQPYIYVEGKAEIEKSADMVTLRFDIVARAPDEQKANAEVQGKANKVFQLLKERKISDIDVIAGDLRSEPQFENQENYQKKGKVIGYAVSRYFRVSVRDIAIFPKLADDIIALGGAEFSGVDARLQKEKEMEGQMWAKAIVNAREQAEKTLKQAEMKIDSLYAISPVPVTEITSTMLPKDRAEVERVIVTGSNIPTAEEGGPSKYYLPTVTVSQIVHVIYLISPAK